MLIIIIVNVFYRFIYQGLINLINDLLQQQLIASNKIQEKNEIKLWSKVYYRNDCDEKHDEYGLPYRHKNSSKIGIDLSSLVIIEDNPLSYRGYEPNTIRCAGFWGQSNPPDNEVNLLCLYSFKLRNT